MSDAITGTYLVLALLMAWPCWYVTGQLGHEQWIRVTLTLAGPFVLLAVIARRVRLGHW